MTWRDVTVLKYQELIKLYEDNQDISLEEFNIKLVSFLHDIPQDELENSTIESYQKLLKEVEFTSKTPPNSPAKSIKTSAGELFLLENLNEITIGEYIDLEHFFSDGFIKNFTIILAIFFRQKTNENPLLYKNKFEDYGDWIYLREELFYELPISQVYGVIPMYLSFKEKLEESFDNLLVSKEDDDEEENQGLENESYKNRAEKIETEQAEENRDKFGWDYFLYRISRLNNCTFEQATKIPLMQAFGLISLSQAFKITI